MDQNPYESPHGDMVASPRPMWRVRLRWLCLRSLLAFVMSIVAAGAVAYSRTPDKDAILDIVDFASEIVLRTSLILTCLFGIGWAFSPQDVRSS